jgi:hypothetical protein
MRSKRRDYRAEYARGIDRGLASGLTRAQARGHPGLNQGLASGLPLPTSNWRKLKSGFRAIKGGKSLTVVAKELRVSPERLRRYFRERDVDEGRGPGRGGSNVSLRRSVSRFPRPRSRQIRGPPTRDEKKVRPAP